MLLVASVALSRWVVLASIGVMVPGESLLAAETHSFGVVFEAVSIIRTAL